MGRGGNALVATTILLISLSRCARAHGSGGKLMMILDSIEDTIDPC